MSSDITRSQVRRQLAAMACDNFDIGILRPDGRMLLREKWTLGQIEQAIQRLKLENARGAHIFVRPHGIHALSLIDDLSVEAIVRMTDAGFEPTLVVETSPRNFQVWLNHGRTLDRNVSSCAAKELAKRFGGDLSSADWRHFGRLAGFTNRKPERLLRNGIAPFACLRESDGRIYDAAREFLTEVKALAEKAAKRASRTTSQETLNNNSARTLAEFHGDLRYEGDLHRADMAWALHAASYGLSEAEIKDTIFHARDLSKKGRIERQFKYAERTAIKAVRFT
jgi:RepB DNA-primase N-terminal domain